MSDDLSRLNAHELISLLKGRKISPVELTRFTLERAERLQSKLNCFINLCPEEAMAEARVAEAAVMSGREIGALVGLPYSVKDTANTKGVRTTYGAAPHRDNIPTKDAVAVERMRKAGAILIGKTTTPEFGTGPLTRSPLFGKTSNAWDPARTSGGSSGGAAAAVAAGIGSLAIASDGGGSTRIPAACNGVVGFKQSQGVIPHNQSPEKFGNLSYVTPMTRTVSETALMMEIMAGGHPSDPTSIGLKTGGYIDAIGNTDNLKGVKIKFSLTPLSTPVSKDVRAAFSASLKTLEALGAELEEFSGADLSSLPVWQVIQNTVWMGQMQEISPQFREQLSKDFFRQLEAAEAYSGMEYRRAMVERTTLFTKVQDLLEPNCYLATPTITRTALPIDQDFFGPMQIDNEEVMDIRAHWYPWTMLFNMTGHPAVSLPAGFGSDGLPIGLQLIGPYREDAHLLRIAAAYESADNYSDRWPAISEI
jgi:aspartyl-tRNA(Asn)/glutamyl-tRNA(Gln) amidotransferase subunit A